MEEKIRNHQIVEEYIKTLKEEIKKLKKENLYCKIIFFIFLIFLIIFIISFEIDTTSFTSFLYTMYYADTNENLTQFARNYTQGTYGIFAANKLSYWINKNIQYSYNGNLKASEVFKLKKGVCKEKAILLVSFMKSLGIPGTIYVLSHKQHAIAKFYDSRGYFYCDPTLGNPFSAMCLDSLDCSYGLCNSLTHRCEFGESLSFCWRPY